MGTFERYRPVWVALTTVAGVLVEVPIVLSLAVITNRTRQYFPVETRS